MTEQETVVREQQITLASKVYVVKELSMRKVRTAMGIIQRMMKDESMAKLVTSGDDHLASIDGVMKVLEVAPKEMAALISLASAGGDILEDIILDASPREIGQAVATIVTMNNFVEAFRKNVPALKGAIPPTPPKPARG